MLRERLTSRLGVFLIYIVIGAIALPLVPLAQAAEEDIDLDGNLANGKESRVVTRVLQSFPVQIENVVHNNTPGQQFNFVWRGAGPSGFNSYVVPGPNVGTKWEWTTVSQVYSIVSPAVFTPVRGVTAFGQQPGGINTTGTAGTFDVPGKSIFPTQVTLSSASLTASLVTFFSPEKDFASCMTESLPNKFESGYKVFGEEDLTFDVEQTDCCLEPHMTICPDGCQFYLEDENNCGDCGIACAFDETCEAGACTPICPPGQSLCDEGCFDLQNGPDRCGDCDTQCAYDESCEAGVCTPICPPGQSLCGEECVDLSMSTSHCGACDNACEWDQFCDTGVCEDLCPGETLCGEECADLQTNASHCGACDSPCDPLYRCSGGECEPDCPPAHVLCGVNCVNLANDPDNCGSCDFECGVQYLCTNGSCEPDCAPGQVVCNEICVDPLTDPMNCGACNNGCAYDEFCGSGTCQPRCPGQTLCGEDCVDLSNDPTNCGACGFNCTSQEICESSMCVPACPSGRTLCDGVCVDLLRDADNCGACGNVCDGENEICIPSCVNPPFCTGACVVCTGPNCEPPPGGTGTASASFASPSEGSRGENVERRRTERVLDLRTRRQTDDTVFASRDRRVLRDDGPAEATVRIAASVTAVEAEVCSLAPQQVTVPAGTTLTTCRTGALVGKEVMTMARVFKQDGTLAGQGTCAQIVPDPDVEITPFLPSPTAVYVLDGGDGLLQPGETADIFITAQNLGPEAFTAVTATISSPLNSLETVPLSFPIDTAGYPDFPAFTTPGDCETDPVLSPQTNLTAFRVTVPIEQAGDVGRVFNVQYQGQGETESVHNMPVVIGIGSGCDPDNIDGESYDDVIGLQSPLNAHLVPVGNPVNYSNKRYNLGSTVPMKLSLGCGGQIRNHSNLDPNPEIVGLVHETAGPQSLAGINGDNSANPNDPFFSCTSSSCDYQFRTVQLMTGKFVIRIKMPDSREFEVGFELK